VLRAMYRDAIRMSALTGEGLDRLREEIRRFMETRRVTVRIRSAHSLGKVLAGVRQVGELLKSEYDDKGGVFVARIEPRHMGRLASLGSDVQLEEISPDSQ